MQNNTDKTLNYYSNNASGLAARYESADVSELQSKLLNNFKGKHRLLELGCGSGRDAAFMMNHGFNVTGLDGSKEMIQSAIELHPELDGNLIAAAIPEDLYKIKKTFDGIYSIATLMHLKKPQVLSAIKGLSTMLAPGGILFFSVSIARNDINETGYDEKGRFFLLLSREEWISICRESGFKEIKTNLSVDGLKRDGVTWLTCVLKKEE